jgi:hypothetical protein
MKIADLRPGLAATGTGTRPSLDQALPGGMECGQITALVRLD